MLRNRNTKAISFFSTFDYQTKTKNYETQAFTDSGINAGR